MLNEMERSVGAKKPIVNARRTAFDATPIVVADRHLTAAIARQTDFARPRVFNGARTMRGVPPTAVGAMRTVRSLSNTTLIRTLRMVVVVKTINGASSSVRAAAVTLSAASRIY